MYFLTASRKEIEYGVVVHSRYIVISISDPGTPRPRLWKPAFQDALFLQFHDAEPVGGEVLPDDVVLMNQRQANEIVDFVERHRDEVGTIVVHCEQGMSRSPAVAIALAEWLGGSAKEILEYTIPNQHVYRLMRAAITTKRQETAE